MFIRFEGTAWLMQRHAKTQMVMVNVIVMTDVLFFILENNHKYTFFMPESNKEKETKVILFVNVLYYTFIYFNEIINYNNLSTGFKTSCRCSIIAKTFS